MYSFFQRNKKLSYLIGPKTAKYGMFRNRRYDSGYMLRFGFFIISLWLFAFALRVGSVSFFTIGGFGDLNFSYKLRSIDRPSSNYIERVENKRLMTYLLLKDSSFFSSDGTLISKQNLYKFFRFNKIMLPNTILTIIADKNCEMELILYAIEIARKEKIKDVFFVTGAKRKSGNI